MTRQERRIAELAAGDLEGWAFELPLGSETRRDLQRSAGAYRFAARVGAGAVALRVVPRTGAREGEAARARQAGAAGAAGAREGLGLAELDREIGARLGGGA